MANVLNVHNYINFTIKCTKKLTVTKGIFLMIVYVYENSSDTSNDNNK